MALNCKIYLSNFDYFSLQFNALFGSLDCDCILVTLIFWKFTQTHNFSFFFNMIIIGKNQVAYSIWAMNLASNNLSKSCLTIVT
jgi:hypothetical protein